MRVASYSTIAAASAWEAPAPLPPTAAARRPARPAICSRMQVVVVGGGIIGAATAHYLAAKGARPLVLEACSPACSASGKAGAACAACGS